MKLGILVNKAKSEIKSDREVKAIGLIKDSLKNIEAAEKTVRVLKKNHQMLLKRDLSDLDDEDLVY